MAGAVIGGLLSAGGGIAGALLGRAQQNPGDNILPFLSPDANRALQAAQFDALGQIGFADPNIIRQAGPLNQLISAINALPISEKIKRRGLIGLQGGQLQREKYAQEIMEVLRRIGITQDDVNQIKERQRDFEQQIDQMAEQIGPFQEDTILNRLEAGRNLASIAAGASGTGDTAFQTRFRDAALRDRTRGIDEAEDALLLRSQFGGFNPAAGLERIAELRSDLHLDAELQGLQRALTAAQGVSALLNPSSTLAQGAAGLSANAQQGALGTAANQAAALNQLRQELSINNADSLSTGVAGGINSLGGALTLQSLLGDDPGSLRPAFEFSVPSTSGVSNFDPFSFGNTQFSGNPF